MTWFKRIKEILHFKRIVLTLSRQWTLVEGNLRCTNRRLVGETSRITYLLSKIGLYLELAYNNTRCLIDNRHVISPRTPRGLHGYPYNEVKESITYNGEETAQQVGLLHGALQRPCGEEWLPLLCLQACPRAQAPCDTALEWAIQWGWMLPSRTLLKSWEMPALGLPWCCPPASAGCHWQQRLLPMVKSVSVKLNSTTDQLQHWESREEIDSKCNYKSNCLTSWDWKDAGLMWRRDAHPFLSFEALKGGVVSFAMLLHLCLTVSRK